MIVISRKIKIRSHLELKTQPIFCPLTLNLTGQNMDLVFSSRCERTCLFLEITVITKTGKLKVILHQLTSVKETL